MKIEDIRPHSYLRVFTRVDGHPMKEAVNNFAIEKGIDGRWCTGFISKDTDSYDYQTRWSWVITQEWLDDPNNFYEILGSPEGLNKAYGECFLGLFTNTEGMFEPYKYGFLKSCHFRFDIDGLEYTEPGYKFSTMRRLQGSECIERRDDGYYETVAARHQPVPLLIAKFIDPPQIELNDGRFVTITHITELGELVYDPVGLKSVPKSLLTRAAYDVITHHRANFKFADSLEDFLVGDEPVYRASSLELPEFKLAVMMKG